MAAPGEFCKPRIKVRGSFFEHNGSPRPAGNGLFVTANTERPSGFSRVGPTKTRIFGESVMLGFELIGYGFLILLFTGIQYACLLTAAPKA